MGLVIFVIRTFPAVEFGVYTLLQTIFTLAVGMGGSFALHPLVKFGAETEDISGPVSASALLYALFLAPVILVILFFHASLGDFFNSETAGGLMFYVALMLAASFPRNVASFLLQSKLDLKPLFLLDAINSLGSLALIAVLVPGGAVATAEGILVINIATLTVSSAYGVWVMIEKYAMRPVLDAGAIRRLWVYGKYSLGASISYTFYLQSDNLIISALMGPVSLAVYNAAKVFTRAYDLIVQLIAILVLPTVSKLQSRNDAAGLITLAEKSFFMFTAFLFVIAASLFFAGPVLMNRLYEGRYDEAIPILKILSISGIFIAGYAVSSSYCFGLGRMKEVFYGTLTTSVAGVLLIFIFSYSAGLIGAASAVVANALIMAVAWVVIFVKRTGVSVTLRGVISRSGDAVDFVRRKVAPHQ